MSGQVRDENTLRGRHVPAPAAKRHRTLHGPSPHFPPRAPRARLPDRWNTPAFEENRSSGDALTLGRIPLGRAHALATYTLESADAAGIEVQHLLPLGSLRRMAPSVGDVSLLAVAPRASHASVIEAFSRISRVSSVLHRSDDRLVTITERGALTIYLADPSHAGAALVWHTGSRAHTRLLQRRASTLGLRFADGHLRDRSGASLRCPTETDAYAALDLPHIPAELREGRDEVDAAASGRLPSLVHVDHILGDLHMHSTWSDGRSTIEDMAAAARELGYVYIAITDHSESAGTLRCVTRQDVPRQRAEIDAARAGVTPMEILHGLEVEILPDGRLDFPDHVLAAFDIVLASLHDQAGQGGAALTERYLRAMRNPYVNVITHPANRTPGGFEGYDLDLDRLFAAAVETGTAVEIDGAPNHLDMDGDVARQAMSAGATVVISSDSHRAAALGDQMRFGVGTARRGWVEPGGVLNTRSLDDVLAFVARKRARR